MEIRFHLNESVSTVVVRAPQERSIDATTHAERVCFPRPMRNTYHLLSNKGEQLLRMTSTIFDFTPTARNMLELFTVTNRNTVSASLFE